MRHILIFIFCSTILIGCGFGIDEPTPTYIGEWSSKYPKMHLYIKNVDGYGDSVAYKVSTVKGVDFLTISRDGQSETYKVERLLGTTLILRKGNEKSFSLLKKIKPAWRY